MSEARRQSHPIQVFTLPRTRRLSWAPVALEYTHQLVLAVWVGGLVAIGLLGIPTLQASFADQTAAARIGLDLLLRASFLGAGAGGFLLLTTLLMHLLALRGQRVTLIQTGLLLGMTLAAVGVHVGLAPPMAELLREFPSLLGPNPPAEAVHRFQRLYRACVGLVGVQALLGAALILLGVRRWYRYVPEGMLRVPGMET